MGDALGTWSVSFLLGRQVRDVGFSGALDHPR